MPLYEPGSEATIWATLKLALPAPPSAKVSPLAVLPLLLITLPTMLESGTSISMLPPPRNAIASSWNPKLLTPPAMRPLLIMLAPPVAMMAAPPLPVAPMVKGELPTPMLPPPLPPLPPEIEPVLTRVKPEPLTAPPPGPPRPPTPELLSPLTPPPVPPVPPPIEPLLVS